MSANKLGQINLIIGDNGTGKTFLLKAIYSTIKTIENYKRGKENRSDKEILADKLYWTFQSHTLGDLVKKGESSLKFSMESDKRETFSFSFGNSTNKQILNLENFFASRESNSIFIPAKEVLSLIEIILESRDNYNAFGFDNTYYDLAKALRPTGKGRNYKEFAEARKSLENSLGGKIDFDLEKKEWFFTDNISKRKFGISITSEGVKKISILDTLLGNHYLSSNSTIFIDEAEANLHPEMISKFMDIIFLLSRSGLQFFITTHSYFVIKKLFVLAQKHKASIPVISFEDNQCYQYDLKDDMPENPIIEESVKLYKEEIETL